MLFSQNTMWAEVSAGRHDHVIAAETGAAYFETLTAPPKRLVWFEESAHEPAFEEPAKFNAAMELVRPALA
jgi:pimeloyl-ACP methyl ester carboxylesterase